jgi:hypothetical protein
MAGKKKRVVKKRAAVKTQPLVSSSKIIFSKFKFGMVLRNLVLFVLLHHSFQ